MGRQVDNSQIERVQAGDKQAWDAFVTRHVALIYAICRGYGLKGRAAAEVNQLVWLQLVENLPRIRTPGSLSGWISATARAICLSPKFAAARSGWADVRPTCDQTGLIAAFLRIGVRCQRLLRIASIRPRPSCDDISAALDMEPDQIEPACSRCLDRLIQLIEADADAPEPSVDHSAVLAQLEQIVDGDSHVPPGWIEAGSTAFEWLSHDAPVAERVYDALESNGDSNGPNHRVASEGRQVRFSLGSTALELLLDAGDDDLVVTGRVVPARAMTVTARWPQGKEAAEVGNDGAFRFTGLPLAPLCLQLDGDQPVKTGWIVP